ncbi:cytochrome c oxidase subunit 3 [Ferruginibacter albus]|uniref:cytochrome c oxidase subunit 3 n=1 Tax=Ferruginibacter albus TaxID=2875540 RepID=UPI001CC75496|nr:cytochrome c oxidase subunit 3 [Ferruginibacter albus]
MSTAAAQQGTKWWSGGRSPFNASYGKVMMWYFLMSDAFTFGAFLISYATLRFSLNDWVDANHVFNAFPFFGHQNLPLAFVSLMTFILIASSVTMVLAVHEGHHMNKKGVEKYMLLTILGGLAFLGCQAWEWTHLLTGEHFILAANGTIETLNTTVSHNPWGHLVGSAEISAALQKTSPEVLRAMILEHDHSATAASLQSLSVSDLISKIDLNAVQIHHIGPPSFGSYFFGITGFHGFHVFSGVVINVIMYIKTKLNHFEDRGHYEMIEKAGLYWHFVDLVWVFVFLCFYLI